MWWCVVEVIRVTGDPVQVSGVSLFPPIGEQAEVLKNIILCMCSDPRTTREFVSVHSMPPNYPTWILFLPRAVVPDITVYRLHHAGLGLSDGCFEAFCLTVTCSGCWSMTYCAIRIHLHHWLWWSRRMKVFPDMVHDLVETLIQRIEVKIGQRRRGLQRWATRPDKTTQGRGSHQGGETDIISYKGGGVKPGDIVTTNSYNRSLSL